MICLPQNETAKICWVDQYNKLTRSNIKFHEMTVVNYEACDQIVGAGEQPCSFLMMHLALKSQTDSERH